MKRTNKKTTSKGKRIVSSIIIVALAAATTFLAGISNDREEEMKKEELLNQKIAIEYVVDMPDSDIILNEESEKKEQKSRKKLWSLLSIPMWMASHLAGLLLKPILGKIFTLILAGGALFGIMCLCLKLMYPGKSLKELLTKRNILVWLCCTAAFYLALNIPEIMNINSDKHGLYTLAEGIVIALAMVLLCKKPDEKQEDNKVQTA